MVALLGSASAPLLLSVVNRANKQPVVYIGESATLDVQLVNDTGTDLALRADDTPTLTVFFPTYYGAGDLAAMSVDLGAMPGWSAAYDAASVAWTITFHGAPATWPAGGILGFSIDKVACGATQADTKQTLQINPSGIAGLPPQVETPLALIPAPKPGRANLASALRFSLDDQGVVFVSNADDPLGNQLTLNITNIGGTPFYSDPKTPRPSQPAPKIVVSFIYGGSRGALAPADLQDGSAGSAWNIRAATTDSSGGEWNATNPSVPSTDKAPSWTLSPAATNAAIIGVGAQSNVGVTFSKIVSFLLPGQTQMVLHCSNFVKDSLVTYDDAVFFLDVVKQFPPPTRGLVNFYGPQPLQEVDRPDQPVTIPLRWAMTNTASIALISTQPGTSAVLRSYASPPPALAYDSIDITLPGVSRTTTLLLTLQAFDAASRYLNSLQFAAQIQANMFVDPRDGAVYPAVRVGRRYWTAANIRYLANSGSWASPGDPAVYGRFYSADAAALSDSVGGWRLPSVADWQDLIDQSGADPYAALIAGGASGFSAQLGGFQDNDGNIIEFGQAGFYWTVTPGDQGGRLVTQFSGGSKSVAVGLGQGLPSGYGCAVRYVRDA